MESRKRSFYCIDEEEEEKAKSLKKRKVVGSAKDLSKWHQQSDVKSSPSSTRKDIKKQLYDVKSSPSSTRKDIKKQLYDGKSSPSSARKDIKKQLYDVKSSPSSTRQDLLKQLYDAKCSPSTRQDLLKQLYGAKSPSSTRQDVKKQPLHVKSSPSLIHRDIKNQQLDLQSSPSSIRQDIKKQQLDVKSSPSSIRQDIKKQQLDVKSSPSSIRQDVKKQQFDAKSSLSSICQGKIICSAFLLGTCDGSCKNHLIHPKMKKPYAWRYQLKNGNKDGYEQCEKDLNDKIESSYRDVNCSKHKDSENTVVDFDSLGKPNECSFYKNQPSNFIRISTPSACKSDENQNSKTATEWKWYWKDQCDKWNVYFIIDLTEKESIGIIESQYLEWLDEGGPNYLHFSAGIERQEYHLMFEEMKQKNLEYSTERPVRRRPAPGINFIPHPFPNHWPLDDEVALIDISSDVENEVRSKFSKTLPDKTNQIIWIKEVVNKRLYKIYLSKRDDMEKHSENLNEMQLWHGTSHNLINTICHQNFDFRLNSTGLYGKGSYFARDAEYSHDYVIPNKRNNGYMFLADVLVGDYTKGYKSYKKPPLKDNKKLIPYDSCANDMKDPDIYVIFDLIQAYPRYVVKYKHE